MDYKLKNRFDEVFVIAKKYCPEYSTELAIEMACVMRLACMEAVEFVISKEVSHDLSRV